MNAADTNTKLLDSYIGLLKNLSTKNKLDLISKLNESIKTTTKKEKSKFYEAFGGWDKQQTADELIKKIRDSRNFNRNLEKL